MSRTMQYPRRAPASFYTIARLLMAHIIFRIEDQSLLTFIDATSRTQKHPPLLGQCQ